MLQEIITGVDNKNKINEIDNFLYDMAKPQDYSGKGGAEVKYIKRYEEMSLILTKYANKDAKKMTVLEYYQAYDALKKENKLNRKRSKK